MALPDSDKELQSTDLGLDNNGELICRLRALVTNIKWSPEETIELFYALLERFVSTSNDNKRGSLTSWMVKLIYSIEMNNVTPSLRLANGKTVMQLVRDNTTTDLEFELSKTTKKNLDQILEEINQNKQYAINKSTLEEVKNIVSSVTAKLSDTTVQNELDLNNDLEKVLFNLCVAVKRTTLYTPHITQMVSWCLMALSKSGWLIQVGTGEGKSCIVAMFAAFRALRGEEVDIMSSSPVLAKRDFDQWKRFFQDLKISAACNTSQIDGELKTCYKCKIVYGTFEQFSWDWLRHHVQKTDIRGKRSFQCAVVDEVDSLMLDNGCTEAILGEEMLALKHLNSILAMIWSTVSQYGKIDSKTDQDSVINSAEKRINVLLKFTPCKLSHREHIYMPSFLQDLVKAKLKLWIKNAFLAKEMTPGHEYIIEGCAIVPVDYGSTGVVQNNREWCDGLQQFLEFKHQDQVKLTDMTAITNYMSSVGLLQMYGDQIYGISGTLGQRSEIETLQKLYKGIKTCQIPSFKRKKLFEVEGVIVDNEEEWIKKICDVVLAQICPTTYRAERAVLVICETINKAKCLYHAVGNWVKLKKLYINNNEDNSGIFKEKLEAGNVIIATNLAGCGTDLKVSDEVNQSGGLFVVQTFLPQNARVEQQAFGRTARQGSPGSAQLIVCSSHLTEDLQFVIFLDQIQSKLAKVLDFMQLYEKHFVSQIMLYQESQIYCNWLSMSLVLSHILTKTSDSRLKKAKEVRDKNLDNRLADYVKNITILKRKQELFNQYLEMLDNLHKIKPLDSHVSSLNETWGVWLLVRFNETESIEDLKSRLDTDMKMAMQKLKLGESPSANLHHYTAYGNDLCVKRNHAEGIKMYTKAIHLDKCWAAFALYNRAFVSLAQKERNQEYIGQALGDLTNALESIEFYQTQIQKTCFYSRRAAETPLSDSDTRFEKHMRAKYQMLKSLKININEAIKKLESTKDRGGYVKVYELPVYLLAPQKLFNPDAFMDIVQIKVQVSQSQQQQELQKRMNNPSYDYLIEFESLKSLGLKSVFILDICFCFAGFLSKIFNMKC